MTSARQTNAPSEQRFAPAGGLGAGSNCSVHQRILINHTSSQLKGVSEQRNKLRINDLNIGFFSLCFVLEAQYKKTAEPDAIMFRQ